MRQWKHFPAVFESDRIDPAIPLTPWAGHRPFAYDFVRNIRPQRIVELGTHTGCSFFSFCQAVKDGRLEATELTAVDTWKGDPHAGFYGEEVYETFLGVRNACYASLAISPRRMQFGQAVADVADNSVDLLHIDGFHTYAAVAKDYQTWLPKLSQDGVVFFHDAHTEAYESTRFWRELSRWFPSFLFEHSWGLGLLFPKGDTVHRLLLEQGFPGLMPFYARIGLLEQALAQSQEDAAAWKRQAGVWWQAAQDAQWKLDQLSGMSP